MELHIEDKSVVNHQVRLPKELNDFILEVAKQYNISKSEAIRSMIKTCLKNNKKPVV